ncbi:hypothetical protein lbkm_2466 [Lachnospiraceae bacterium KM106-2]|nr:hypothetical protein lbkm_2466 [Lachnospiraceae bacterium KM106-2]
MVLNMMALIVLGKYIERKLGSIKYGLYFIGISVLDALIISLIYPNNMSAGASGGIFGVIGVAFVMKLMK